MQFGKYGILLLWAAALYTCQPPRRTTLEAAATPDSVMIEPDKFRAKLEAGIDFIATGNEPFWSLEINFDEIIRFRSLTGDSLNTPSVEGVRIMDVAATSYRAKTEAGDLNVVIYDQSCTDNMSGAKFPKRVEVTLNDKRYSGCGRFLYDYRLQDIWVLERINDQPVRADSFPRELPRLELNVSQNRVFGHTGCNTFNGPLEVQGKRIKFGRLATTLMACPTGSTFEQQYVRSLWNRSLPYRVEPGKLQLQISPDSVFVYRKVD